MIAEEREHVFLGFFAHGLALPGEEMDQKYERGVEPSAGHYNDRNISLTKQLVRERVV